MPLGSYYGGRGEQVAASMKRRYGKDWESYFYGRANKTGLTPGTPQNKKAALKAMADDRKRRRS